MEYVILPLCLGCWVLPLVLIGVTYAIVRAAAQAIQTRGASGDGLYCAKCRFDVRGNASWRCPECGGALNQNVSPAHPRGGILVKDLHPPMSRAMAVILFLIGGFVPSVIAVLILGMVLPINDVSSISATVSFNRPGSLNLPYPIELSFNGTQRRSWAGGKGLEGLEYYSSNSSHSSVTLYPASNDESFENVSRKLWLEIVDENQLDTEAGQYEALSRDFVEVLTLIVAGDIAAAEAHSDLFIVEGYTYGHTSFHPLYTLFCFAFVITAMALLVRYALREVMGQEQAFVQRVDEIHARFGAIVDANQARVQGAKT